MSNQSIPSNYSFKTQCKPLPSFQVHKTLCQKYTPDRKKTELLETYDKYRDENIKNYKEKCEEFMNLVKEYHDDNYSALIHNKSSSRRTPELVCTCNPRSHCAAYKKPDNSLPKVISTSGTTRRQRTVRYFYEKPESIKQRCELEPWLKRYLVLSRFVNVARSVIIKNRMLKRLEILRTYIQCPKLLLEYEEGDFEIECVIYPEICKKFQQ